MGEKDRKENLEMNFHLECVQASWAFSKSCFVKDSDSCHFTDSGIHLCLEPKGIYSIQLLFILIRAISLLFFFTK